MMIDSQSLAAVAVGVMQGVAGSAVWELIKAKLVTPEQAQAIEAVERDPLNDGARKAFEAALMQVLSADRALAEELAWLLLLVPWQARVPRRELRSEADLLTPYRRCTDMVGREQDMADLLAWVDSDKPIAIRVITGGAGSGKTRIALELMTALETPSDGAWHTGFLSADKIEEFAARQAYGNTLAVIDYAATASGHLKKWFEQLADSRGADGKLRILLLEREANADTGWWGELARIGTSQSHERLLEYTDRGGPVSLRTLSAGDRRTLFQSMLTEAAHYLGQATAPRLPEPGENEQFDKQLSHERWGQPLYLMMAALAALAPGGADVVGVLSLTRADLAMKVAEHEVRRMERFASGVGGPAEAVLGLAARATLCRGIPADERIAAAKEELDARGLEWPGGPGKLADALNDALPGRDGGIGFVEPDIVGEALALQVLCKLPEPAQGAILRAAGRAEMAVVGSVIRAVQDLSADDVPEPMEWLKALIESGAADHPGLLVAIDSAMPEQTTRLRERAVEVTQLVLDRLALGFEGAEDADLLSAKSRLLNNLSVRLSDVGRRDDALEKAQQAARIYGELAASNPDAFLPDVAMSLNNLATMLRAVGRRDDALEKAQEAARIHGELAASNPDVFLPYLAMSLNNLANRLSDVGRRDDALEKAQEAARIHGELAASNPDAFLPDLARSLNNLANRLSDVGRRDDALEKAQEAVRIREQLAASNPDAFLPDLARSLNNLANRLSDVGRRDDALEKAQEAVRIYGELAASNPDAFLPDLATSLNNLATMLSDVGRREDALEKAQEAARIYGELAASNPDAFLPDLAASLNNLATMLSDVGRREDALEKAQEAVRIYGELAASNPDAFLPDLATSLNNLATMPSDVGRREDALEKAQEAARIYGELAASNPDAFLPDLARSLNNLATMLSDVGRREDALEKAQEAARIYGELAASNPDAFLPDLARSLNNLAAMLSDVGRRDDALEKAQEAVRIYGELAASNPDAFLPDVARSLAVQARCLLELERPAESVQIAAQSLESITGHLQAMPPPFARLAGAILRVYLRAVEAAGVEPGMESLLPVIAILKEQGLFDSQGD